MWDVRNRTHSLICLPAFDIYASLWFSKGLKLGRHVNKGRRIGSDKALDCFLFGWNVLGSFLTY